MGKALGHGIGCDALSRLAGDGVRVSDMSVGVYMWEKRRVSRGIDVKHFMDSGALFWHGWAFRWRLLSVPSAYFCDSICRRRHCRIHTFCTCTSRPMDIGMVERMDAQIVWYGRGSFDLEVGVDMSKPESPKCANANVTNAWILDGSRLRAKYRCPSMSKQQSTLSYL